MRRDRGPYLLLYDGDCRICTAFARGVKAVDLRGRIQIQAIQESRDLLRSLPGEEILDAVHAVSPDGRVATGADAIPLLLAGLTDAAPLEPLLNRSVGVRAASQRFYDVLVGLRGHLTCRYDAASSELRSPR